MSSYIENLLGGIVMAALRDYHEYGHVYASFIVFANPIDIESIKYDSMYNGEGAIEKFSNVAFVEDCELSTGVVDVAFLFEDGTTPSEKYAGRIASFDSYAVTKIPKGVYGE